MKNTWKFALKHCAKHGVILLDMRYFECENSKFRIKTHKAPKGEVLDVVNMRMSLFGGIPPVRTELQRVYNMVELIELNDDGSQRGRWMSNHPSETFTQIYPALKAHGNVLIGGLGLGLVIRLIEMYNKNEVSSITCVEKSQELIDFIGGWFPDVDFICSDLLDFIKKTRRTFDFGYYDIWASTGEHVYYNTVLPLRFYSDTVVKEIVCWNEESMIGQVVQSVESYIQLARLQAYITVKGKNHIPNVKKINKYYSPVAYHFYSYYDFKELLKMPEKELHKKVLKFVETFKWKGDDKFKNII